MMLNEAVRAFEREFTISGEVGFPDKILVTRVDMERAPTGEFYRDVTSGGWFDSEEQAAVAWLREALSYADERGGSVLYWRERPVWAGAEFVALDQAALLNNYWLRPSTSLRIGRVFSRLLVATKGVKGEGAHSLDGAGGVRPAAVGRGEPQRARSAVR